MAPPLVTMSTAEERMSTAEDRAHGAVAVEIEGADYPWMRDHRTGSMRAVEPAVWIEHILDELDSRV